MRTAHLVAIGVAGLGMLGQAAGFATQPAVPPIRDLGPIVARSTEQLSNGASMRVLTGGRLILNDQIARRVVVLDSTLTRANVIIDSTGTAARLYGTSISILMPFRADSTLFYDFAASALLVLDPVGKIARIMALPQFSPEARTVVNMTRHQLDRTGRFVYEAPSPAYLTLLPPTWVGDTIMAGADSVALLGLDLMAKRTDTIAMLEAPRARQSVVRLALGSGSGRAARTPFPPAGDVWVVLDDGTIAIVRIRDYHVDWIHPDGSKTSGPKVAHTWVHVTDSMKTAIMDSVRAAEEPALNSAFLHDSVVYDSLSRAFAAQVAAGAGRGRGGLAARAGPRPARTHYIDAADLPDYLPPFTGGSTFADADGNVWMHAYLPVKTDTADVYEVIDRKGALIDRVRIPGGTALIGFCPGFAILRARVGSGIQIAKARIH